jgi:hypothetical protein
VLFGRGAAIVSEARGEPAPFQKFMRMIRRTERARQRSRRTRAGDSCTGPDDRLMPL